MTIRIEVFNDDNSIDVSKFVVLNDDIKIIDYYLELLDWQGCNYIVYQNGVPHVWNTEGGEQ
jgi:hypothetical protein